MARNLLDRVPLLAIRLLRALQNETGQALAEYGVILTVVAVGVVVPTLLLFRAEIAATFSAATGCFDGSC